MAKFREERKRIKVVGLFRGFSLSELPSLKHLKKHPRELAEIQTPKPHVRGPKHVGLIWVASGINTFIKVLGNWCWVNPHWEECLLLLLCLLSHVRLCDTRPARLLRPWDSPDKNTGVGGHFLLQGIFPTQGWNLCLLHCRQILYH